MPALLIPSLSTRRWPTTLSARMRFHRRMSCSFLRPLHESHPDTLHSDRLPRTLPYPSVGTSPGGLLAIMQMRKMPWTRAPCNPYRAFIKTLTLLANLAQGPLAQSSSVSLDLMDVCMPSRRQTEEQRALLIGIACSKRYVHV